jgi:hypothetical protein
MGLAAVLVLAALAYLRLFRVQPLTMLAEAAVPQITDRLPQRVLEVMAAAVREGQ